MLNVALARNTGQDLAALLGVRRLNFYQRLVSNEMAKELMESEFRPLDMLHLLGGVKPRQDD